MAGWSGSGVFSKTYSWVSDAANGIGISSSRHDQNDNDFTSGINNCLTKDGQNSATSNLPMGGNRHTGVGNASALSDYASAEDVVDQSLTYYTAAGTDTYTLSPNPSITSYTAGQRFSIKFTNENTGAATLNVSSVGAKDIVDSLGNALVEGNVVADSIYDATYDGTNFVINTSSTLFEVATPSDGDLLKYSSTKKKFENVPFGFVGVQTGTIHMFAGTTVASEYLLCNGQAVSRTTYAGLYTAIGDAYGEGDGATTFNVPDLRGRFPRGVDGGAGRDPDAAGRTASATGGNTGDNVGSIQIAATAQANTPFATDSAGAHTHSITTNAGGTFINGSISGNGGGGSGTGVTQSAGAHTHTISGGDNETRPVNLYVNFIIKT